MVHSKWPKSDTAESFSLQKQHTTKKDTQTSSYICTLSDSLNPLCVLWQRDKPWEKTHSVSVIDMFSCECLQFQAEPVSCCRRRHAAESSRVADSSVSPSVTLSSLLFSQSQLFLRSSATLPWNCLIGTRKNSLQTNTKPLWFYRALANKCHLK